ncbi:hypothetical protein [Acinetobacter sp. MD2(2019)]|uniref:hypothetical protein n=1 Tax=Acinetobacter sp. MD2(2019) TaxID=2605273 RepID=UPI002D1EC48F|nr:hypothetical protein [Acinetobacter sp. MD2(2019)]MEB3753979.1 hypothetical protein [Acinetobacter sp. MD2(2019)]
MKKYLVLIGAILLTGCTKHISFSKIDNIYKNNNVLNFSMYFNKNDLNEIKELSSKKMDCKDVNNKSQLLYGYVKELQNNRIDFIVSYCENNDKGICNPKNINNVKEINLQCQGIFSAMLGDIHKTDKFIVSIDDK